MFEAAILFKLLSTSILETCKRFESLVCCLKGICVHPYTIPPAKLAPDVGIMGCLWSENDAIMSWWRLISNLRLLHTSIFDIYKVLEPLVCSLKGIWVHPYVEKTSYLMLNE